MNANKHKNAHLQFVWIVIDSVVGVGQYDTNLYKSIASDFVVYTQEPLRTVNGNFKNICQDYLCDADDVTYIYWGDIHVPQQGTELSWRTLTCSRMLQWCSFTFCHFTHTRYTHVTQKIEQELKIFANIVCALQMMSHTVIEETYTCLNREEKGCHEAH